MSNDEFEAIKVVTNELSNQIDDSLTMCTLAYEADDRAAFIEHLSRLTQYQALIKELKSFMAGDFKKAMSEKVLH